jgi:hypothetical protein
VQGTEGLGPSLIKRAVREYRAVLDDAAFGAATLVTPKYFAPVDPPRGGLRQTAAWRSSPMQPILIDLDHSAIVEVEVCSAYAIFGRSRVFN